MADFFVADRGNSRVQIFDANGKFVAEWKQFGRPSDVAIDKNDMIYVTDDQSNQNNNPGFKTGVRIGSAKDGKVTAFIPTRPVGHCLGHLKSSTVWSACWRSCLRSWRS
jgi:hypothetical protein